MLVIPETILNIIKRNRGIIAGGALVSKKYDMKINDYDFYFKTEEDFKNAVKEFDLLGIEPCFMTKKALSYTIDDHKIQLIRVLFGPVHKILNSFDLRICQIGYDYEDESYHDYDSNLIDSYNRDIKDVLNPEYFKRLQVSRLFKYQEKGFINKKSLLDYLDSEELLIHNKKFKDKYYHDELP